jgi:5'-methylthioadenosine phosphorylase
MPAGGWQGGFEQMQARLAVIGGSGLYGVDGASVRAEVDVPTPFGMPSDLITIVEISGEMVAFLPRHGRGHRYLPAEVPAAANIWALKSLGVEQILAVSAVGSLQEDLSPGDFVLCDQLVDRTTGRKGSFFGGGIAGHVPFADPFCFGMRERLSGLLVRHGQSFRGAGTYVCMEGPLFSTRAESALHRSWGAQVIGMTAVPEARLAREAEMCYATIALVTDWDCWRESTESVSVEMVVSTMKKNTAAIQRMLPDAVSALRDRTQCPCRSAARDAVMTDPALIPYDVKRKLALLYGKYWKK